MKKLSTVLFALSLVMNVNCGSPDDGDCDSDACDSDTDTGGGNDGGGNDDQDDDTVIDNLAPFRSTSACVLEFSVAYIDGTNCAQVRGGLPGITWSSGVDLGSEHDGYRSVNYQMAAGTYELSYVGWANCSSRSNDVWADYGTKEHLAAMSADARKFINCNWWNASQSRVNDHVSSPSCNLRISVNSAGVITAAGNMANYDGQ
jgi:hypothetical protein